MKTLIILAIILLSLLTYMSLGQTYSDITYDAGTSLDVGSGADVCAGNIYINGSFSGSGTLCTGPLPVTLSSFTYNVNKRTVKLTWKTEAELNNFGFDIERKQVKEGSVWQKIGFINGNGTTNEPKEYFFENINLHAGKYEYRLKQIDFNGNYEYFSLMQEVVIVPPGIFSLGQNYPNPSNPKCKINFELPVDGWVSVKVYDITGREVLTLMDEMKTADYYTIEFNGSSLASGVYFYKIRAVDFSDVKKMILVK